MASFNAGGLASGMDTNAIVETLTKLEARPLNLLHNRQAAMRSQVSLLGDLSSKLGAFKTAMSALSTTGALGVSASTNTAFTLAPTTRAAPGSYQVAVTSLASAAKERSNAYASPSSQVAGGYLTLDVQGTQTEITIDEGTALDQVALQINQSGAAVTAAVISDGASSYLSITNRDTGFTEGSPPSSALTVTMNTQGSIGTPLTTSNANPATNATFLLDGLPVTRKSNTITDAIPGASLTLKALSPVVSGLPVPEEGVLTSSVDLTAKNLGNVVDAYNTLIKAVQKQVQVTPGGDRSSTLAGDSTVRSLQRALQGLLTTQVPGNTDVRSLADVGVKTARDGTISLDLTVMGAALDRNPQGLNQLFSQAGTGLSTVSGTFVDNYVNPTDGMLTSRTSGLTKSISVLDETGAQMQVRIDSFKANLIKQFTAMETVVSGLKSVGNFLASQQPFKVES